MSNTSAPNGFNRYAGTGSAPTMELTQVALSASDTRPLFFGDPVVQAAQNSAGATPGAATGFITQGYPQVALTVGATALATNASGALTATFSAATPAGGNVSLPASWVPPVGSQMVVSGATPSTLDGVYTVGSATGTTAVALPNSSAPASTTSTASGSVTVFVPVAGIFAGCKYLSVAQKRTVWSNYWPGSDANTNASVTAYIVNDPNAQFEVQGGNSGGAMASAIGQAAIGQPIGFAYAAGSGSGGNGNPANGLSTAIADQNTLQGFSPPSAPQLLPFRVVGPKNFTPDGSNPLAGINGNDATSANNRIVVAFNNAVNKH